MNFQWVFLKENASVYCKFETNLLVAIYGYSQTI